MTTLLPTSIFDSDSPMVAAAYGMTNSGNMDTLVYPSEYDVHTTNPVPVCVIFHSHKTDETLVLTTHLDPLEQVVPSDTDTLRLFRVRRDAYSYADRFSRVIGRSSL